jgi:phosphate transport system substrate-binding protein
MSKATITIVFFLLLSIFGCDSNVVIDNQTSGSIAISVDETYQLVMEEQVKIFEGRNPRCKINAVYKPEADCIQDFLKDTTRLIFITRPLNDDEKAIATQSKIAITRELPLLRDAIAFIVPKGAKSEFTQTEFVKILNGQSSYQFVFDNQNSSVVRYVQDSILKGQAMSKNNFAAKNTADLIKYISTNQNAIGAIGVASISDDTDSSYAAIMQKIDLVGILPYNDSLVRFRKPIYQYIANKEYPYCRELFFISKEGYVGLGTGFANYLGKDGQLVFNKVKLFPLQYETRVKEIKMK